MKKKGNAMRNIVLISQLGINICVPAFICLFIGLGIDYMAGTGFFSVVFLMLGILGGGKSAYIIAMNSVKMDEEKKTAPEDIVKKYNNTHKGEVDDNFYKKN